ncbi:MAG: M56 family metallopeptidase, partial [Phycisphaerae bacterium]|nr:M56 family metallopeptidase [Phycisphaerae bacterium]
MAACPPVTFSLLKAPQEAPPQPLHDEPITMPVPPDDLHAEQLPAPPTDEAALIITNEADASADKISGSTDAAAPVGSDGVIKEKPAGVNWSSWDYWKRFAPYVTVVYLLGVATMFARLLLALRGGRRLRKISRPVNDAALLATIAAKAGQIGLRFTPAVAYCWQVAVPTVIGVLRPMVLLPVSFATGLSAEQVEAILAHELAHIRRYDYLLNLLQRVIESLLFFHPAVWFISRRIRIERENCCDDMVVSAGGEAYSYAASLVRTAELSLASRSACRLVAAAALGATDKPS